MLHRHKDLEVHFVGIGGIGMSGIAEVLLNLGYRVTGSDLKPSDITRRLESLGGRVAVGHAAEHVGEADAVVISSAVKPSNPEVVEARRRGIPVIPRAEMLAELMRMKYGVAVAGSHGKTTTTSMVAALLDAGGLDPTVVNGGHHQRHTAPMRSLGEGEWIVVAEADESDGTFLQAHSRRCAIVTNIDPEHLDHYGSLEALKRTFVDFINKVPFYGLAVLCRDHAEVRSILPLVGKRHVTYGFTSGADYSAGDVRFDGMRSRFTATRRTPTGRLEPLGEVTVAMPGTHNVLNSLAVIAVADFLGVPFATTRAALEGFQGVGRRFTVRGEAGGVMVVDDYGHHPAEIRATLAGARAGFSRRIVAAFQPHRYTRTRDLLGDFARAFHEADEVLITDIYPAGEEAIPGVSAEALCSLAREAGHPSVRHVPRRADVAATVVPLLREGDLFVTLGAGDITLVCEEVLRLLRAGAGVRAGGG